MSERTCQERVVLNLSALIAQELKALSSEFWTPQFNPDQMDSELEFRRKRIVKLRVIREEFENIMHGLTRVE